MSILEFFGLKRVSDVAAGSAETQTVRNIVERLDNMDPEEARFVAAFAYILSRVANADMQISREETRAMERIVTEHGGLPEEQALIVVQMAKSQNLLFGGTENFLVTREMKRIASPQQKIALLDCIFAVSSADGSISTAEDTVMRQIATELGLGHGEFIEVRSRFRKFLAVLQKQEPTDEPPGQGS